MRTFQFHCIFVALFCLTVGFMVQAGAQTEFPQCGKDGTPPDGKSQCSCAPWVYRDEIRDVERGYQVRLPDGVVAIGPCRAGGTFQISLTHPKSSETGNDLPWSQISVAGEQESEVTVQEIADNFAKNARKRSDSVHATDLAIDQPMMTSLSSLPAIRLKATWTELDRGKLIHEVIVANNSDKSIAYEIVMVSPAYRYEKDRRLLETVVDGFSCIPRESAEKH